MRRLRDLALSLCILPDSQVEAMNDEELITYVTTEVTKLGKDLLTCREKDKEAETIAKEVIEVSVSE